MKFQDLITESLSKEEILKILNDMDVPQMRINTFDRAWLLRNLAVRNKEHKDFKKVITALKKI